MIPVPDLATASRDLSGDQLDHYLAGYFEGARHAYVVGMRHGWNERVDHERAAWQQMAQNVRQMARMGTHAQRAARLPVGYVQRPVPSYEACMASWQVNQ
jgi:hypothetical protein